MTRPYATADRLLPGLLLFWAGLAAGVAFLATPVKFLAPTLTRPAALDVGRQTFRAYNATEIVLIAFALIVGVLARSRSRWYRALAVPILVVALQSLWLLPALDRRLLAVLAQGPAPAPSPLHAVYIGLEALKVAALVAFGLSLLRGPHSRDWWR
jgi:hypothetical protein